MIGFFADNHYGVHPGKVIFEHLPSELQQKIAFFEDDWSDMETPGFAGKYELLILNMIGDTCDVPHPAAAAEKEVRSYLEKGGSMVLLHGSGAAFWQWEWWRKIVGFRWVRPNDPDGVEASYHPVKPYMLRKCKSRHLLMDKLQEIALPEDEIYAKLEQVSPAHVFMETAIEEGVFPQCFEVITPWGGKLVHFIPGHSPEVTSHPAVIRNICEIINYLENK
ncbi:MAG: ThuA domain-containing protein [Lentisphaeria bacterium]|nr:ThuA domain-containing protein [Lentisphaeria bacterium]MBQ9776710.1 ThuA domain-containing protein [Lentisphaeria bacterium]